MSAKSFEEWYAKERGNLALYTMDDDLRAAWTASRAALLADRPDVAGLVEALGHKTQIDEDGTMIGVSHQAVDEARATLESLAAQLAEREAELAKVKALAEKMHAELKEYENSPFRHTSNSAWEYRAAYPKDAP